MNKAIKSNSLERNLSLLFEAHPAQTGHVYVYAWTRAGSQGPSSGVMSRRWEWRCRRWKIAFPSSCGNHLLETLFLASLGIFRLGGELHAHPIIFLLTFGIQSMRRRHPQGKGRKGGLHFFFGACTEKGRGPKFEFLVEREGSSPFLVHTEKEDQKFVFFFSP